MAEGKKVGSIYIDLGMKADTFSRGMTKAENAIRGFGSKVKSTLTTIKNFIYSWKTLVIGAMVAAFAGAAVKKAIGGLKTLVRGVIEASSTYEQLRMTLKVLLKDQDKANKAFDEARELAASTAFSIEEITRGYTQMLTFGFEQSKIPETLLLAADAATAFGQNLDEVIRSLNYLKAGRKGEALESLARFGIARPELTKRGAKFSAGGELETSTEETLNIIYEIWKEKVGGMSEEGTKTWKGMVSNLKDAWTDFQATIGEAGFFDAVKNQLAFILSKISEWAANGQLQEWAEKISQKMTSVFNGVVAILSKIFNLDIEMDESAVPEWADNVIKEIEGGGFAERISQALQGLVREAFADNNVIGDAKEFGKKVGHGIYSGILDALEEDRPLLYKVFSGWFGEVAGEAWGDFKSSTLNPFNMRF